MKSKVEISPELVFKRKEGKGERSKQITHAKQ